MKYYCRNKHKDFLFDSEHEEGTRENAEDARDAYAKKSGCRYPVEDFLETFSGEDYDESAIN